MIGSPPWPPPHPPEPVSPAIDNAARELRRLRSENRALRAELEERRACLVAARADLMSIAGAKVEDGGLWIRAVAHGRIELVNQAIDSTDRALAETGSA